MRKQLIILMFCTILFVGFVSQQNQDRTKVLKFSHETHVTGAEMTCLECHAQAEESEKAEDRILPEKDVCANCHEVEDEENCSMCHLDVDNAEAFENPIRKIIFTHKKHVADEKLECEKCHPNMAEVTMGNNDKIPGRETCNNCHNGLTASMQCLNCHSTETQFRPDNHSNNWSREHMNEIRAGDSDCAHCHTNNYCQQCHESTDLISTKILAKDFYSPMSPQLAGEQTVILKSVHQLNYRFIHQLDASGKEKDCRICHETSSYCGQCHDISSNPQIRPAWHGGPDWGAIALAVGSGGGRHAEFARRDIERCAACHDVQGADPTCLMCHTDFDGIRNTDPKTHESGYSNRFDEGSNFHNDEGALCFTCHTNTNQAGVGFCSYCHGTK
jgi:hypothetical protein